MAALPPAAPASAVRPEPEGAVGPAELGARACERVPSPPAFWPESQHQPPPGLSPSQLSGPVLSRQPTAPHEARDATYDFSEELTFSLGAPPPPGSKGPSPTAHGDGGSRRRSSHPSIYPVRTSSAPPLPQRGLSSDGAAGGGAAAPAKSVIVVVDDGDHEGDEEEGNGEEDDGEEGEGAGVDELSSVLASVTLGNRQLRELNDANAQSLELLAAHNGQMLMALRGSAEAEAVAPATAPAAALAAISANYGAADAAPAWGVDSDRSGAAWDMQSDDEDEVVYRSCAVPDEEAIAYRSLGGCIELGQGECGGRPAPSDFDEGPVFRTATCGGSSELKRARSLTSEMAADTLMPSKQNSGAGPDPLNGRSRHSPTAQVQRAAQLRQLIAAERRECAQLMQACKANEAMLTKLKATNAELVAEVALLRRERDDAAAALRPGRAGGSPVRSAGGGWEEVGWQVG